MDYCDTNILTAFVNRDNIDYNFGKRYKVKKIFGFRNIVAENKLKNLNECVISRVPLMRDLGGNPGAVGGFLTSRGLKNIKIVNINGFDEGREAFDHICKRLSEKSRFYKKFCEDKKIKNDLDINKKNDIAHFGSAIKINAENFITADKDFKEVGKYFKKINVI